MEAGNNYIVQDGCWNCNHSIKNFDELGCNVNGGCPQKPDLFDRKKTHEYLEWFHDNSVCTAGKCLKWANTPKISQEPIIHIDATPDEGYPLRILKAYRENCNCVWVSDPDNLLISQMNQDCRRRAAILDKAISALEQPNPARKPIKPTERMMKDEL